MATHFGIKFTKTYSTPAKAKQAVEREKIPNSARYTILPVETEKGIRYGVLFVGREAIELCVHFHFNVVA